MFSEKSKYGTAKVKEILKTNVLMCLLMNNIANHRLPNYNMLYNVASTPFKTMNDVQALFGLVEAFTNK